MNMKPKTTKGSIYFGLPHRKMKFQGEMLTVLSGYILNNPWPSPPSDKYAIPIPPDIKAKGGDALAQWKKKTRAEMVARFNKAMQDYEQKEACVEVEILFPQFRWKGGAIGAEVGREELYAGFIDKNFDLILPDGRKLEGRTDGITDAEVQGNKARLEIDEMAAEDGGDKKPTKRQANYLKPKWGAAEIKIAQSKIQYYRKDEKGISDAEIVRRMPDEWKNNSVLNQARCPSDPTFKGWVAQVRTLGYIRQSRRINVTG